MKSLGKYIPCSVVRICTLAVCIIAFAMKVEAKDFLSAPQEKDLLTCSDGTMMKGLYYATDKKIERMFVNDKVDYIMLEDEKGVYRICRKQTMEVVSELRSRPMLTRYGYFLNKGDETSFYNYGNLKLWTANGPCVCFSDTLGIAVCLRHEGANYANKGLVEGIYMKSGNKLWNKVVPYKYHYPWTEVFSVDERPDYSYLIADSLYLLNSKTGAMTVRAFCSSAKESVKSILSVVKPVPLPTEEWRKEAATSYGFMGRVSGTHSSWVQSGDSLFIADAENLYCFNLLLEELWRTPLPDAMGSKSELRLRGDKLYLLNFGVGFQNGLVGRCGKPFYATYERSTGKQLQLVVPDANMKLLGGCYVPGKVYLQDKSDLYYINEGEEKVHRIKWTPNTNTQAEYDIPERVIYDTVYVKQGDALVPITTNEHQLVVELNDYDINVVDINGKVTKYPGSQVFFHDYRNVYSTNSRKVRHYAVVDDKTMKVRYDFVHGGYCMVLKSGDIWILDDNGIGCVKSPQ